jgi:hypothetical protein
MPILKQGFKKRIKEIEKTAQIIQTTLKRMGYFGTDLESAVAKKCD